MVCISRGGEPEGVTSCLIKSQSRDIEYHNDYIDLKFHRHLGNAAAEGAVKCQSDW